MKSIGKYTLTKQIVQTNQMKIYTAINTVTQQSVNIKVLNSNYKTLPSAKQFQDFQTKVTSLHHPYIAHIYEVGLVNNCPFIVVESLDHRTLADSLAELQAMDTIALLSTTSWQLKLISDALDYVHTQGIVHGNLTPHNILLTDVDEPILTDFGLINLQLDNSNVAKKQDHNPAPLLFMSPEQLDGHPGDVLSDVYALGVILYYQIFGQLPFTVDPLVDYHPNALSSIPTFSNDLPEAIQQVILKAIAVEPNQRFASAGALSIAFASVLDDTSSSTVKSTLAVIDPNQKASPVILSTIGRYTVEAELGQRGNFIIYRAYDLKLERPVAIKILSPQVEIDQKFRTQFQHEVALIAKLEHRSIVEVYDYGEHENRPYVVMSYLDAGTLETHLKAEGTLSLSGLTPIIKHIAAGLDEAHSQGIIHGQIMPSNILFDARGKAYLSDFSIFTLSEAWVDLSNQVDADKKARYLSPEQVKAFTGAEEAQLTPASDVYTLGIVIFEALTGQVPFQGQTPVKTALAHLTDPVPALHQINPDLPKEYQKIIDRTLAKEAKARYPTAKIVADRLQELQAGRWHMSRISDLIDVGTVQTPIKQIVEEPDDKASASPPQTFSGKMFGRYQLEKELGRGAMGIVYLAYDPGPKRQVAIKVLPNHLSTIANFRDQFHYEAKLIAKFDHDYIAHIYDFGEYENQLFIVMQYLSGGTLTDKLAQKPLKLRQIAPVIERVAIALDAAHKKQIIHYDVKPGNILFDTKGQAFLSDFGIAVMQTDTDEVTVEKNIGGTPKYMSPEQIRVMAKQLNADTLDGRSDIYSLGVVLFQMLTNQVPYQGSTPRETVMAHLSQPIPQIADIKTGLPAGCQQIIDKALAKEPINRYQTGQELASDVKDLASARWFLRRLMD